MPIKDENFPEIIKSSQPKKIMDNKPNKNNKKKKVPAKNCLDDPFSVELPYISSKDHGKIVDILKENMSGLNITNFRPSIEEIEKVPKKDRKKFKVEFKVNAIKQLKEEDIDARKELTIGFNAVMRGIENDRIVCVFIDASAKPEFLVKMFVPPCSVKKIPLIAVNSLKNIVSGDDMLGVKKCLALGLNKSVLKISCRFRLLYSKCCKILGLDSKKEGLTDDTENELESKVILKEPSKEKQESVIKASYSRKNKLESKEILKESKNSLDKLSDSTLKSSQFTTKKSETVLNTAILTHNQIAMYHLPKLALGKAFRPNQLSNITTKVPVLADDFLSFGSTDKNAPLEKHKENGTDSYNSGINKNKWNNNQIKAVEEEIDTATIPSEFLFELDCDGEDVKVEKEEQNKDFEQDFGHQAEDMSMNDNNDLEDFPDMDVQTHEGTTTANKEIGYDTRKPKTTNNKIGCDKNIPKPTNDEIGYDTKKLKTTNDEIVGCKKKSEATNDEIRDCKKKPKTTSNEIGCDKTKSKTTIEENEDGKRKRPDLTYVSAKVQKVKGDPDRKRKLINQKQLKNKRKPKK